MGEAAIISVDLAKNVFQLRGAAADGSVVLRKKPSRPQFARFMAAQSPCLVAVEAWACVAGIGRGKWRGAGMTSG